VRSIELRWFCEREPSEAALERFADRGHVEARTDHYLWGDDEAIGVKLRGGQLETKRRSRVEPFELDRPGLAHIRGTLEHWQKSIEPPRSAQPSERWIAVDKQRALRSMSNARAELTRLELHASPGLLLRGAAVQASVAFEVFPGAGVPALRRAVEELADEPEFSTLGPLRECMAAWSGGYPAWLLRCFTLAA